MRERKPCPRSLLCQEAVQIGRSNPADIQRDLLGMPGDSLKLKMEGTFIDRIAADDVGRLVFSPCLQRLNL